MRTTPGTLARRPVGEPVPEDSAPGVPGMTARVGLLRGASTGKTVARAGSR
ncbi:hypothetical protein [Kineococcus sp. SYSU DK006]|uniref:hypothetical protein n=1 Tax=Kineococcus sp. SYSU DK006 TaxID=3383127 RepID=UPI003D7CD8AD